MIILLSPAKTIKFDRSLIDLEYTIPEFEAEAFLLHAELKKKDFGQVKKLMQTSDILTEQIMVRIANFNNFHNIQNSRMSILAYMGAVYEGMQAWSFSNIEMKEVQKRLRILSGFYGILRPLDLIQYHRLEMGAKMKFGDYADLYHFWNKKVYTSIKKIIDQQNNDVIINLASKEYSDVVDFKKIGVKVITPIFKNKRNSEYKNITILMKRARGLMVSFIIKNSIYHYKDLCGFDMDGYYYNQELSNDEFPVFTSEW